MTEDDIRNYLGESKDVQVFIAGPGDGSPEIAWGDTFISALDEQGEPRKMPFTTIVTKDYDGFDEESKLNRGGLYRLNMDVGQEKFIALFGFKPRDLELNRQDIDFTAIDQLFPHPLYGAQGWVSIINPSDASREMVTALLDYGRVRACRLLAG